MHAAEERPRLLGAQLRALSCRTLCRAVCIAGPARVRRAHMADKSRNTCILCSWMWGLVEIRLRAEPPGPMQACVLPCMDVHGMGVAVLAAGGAGRRLQGLLQIWPKTELQGPVGEDGVHCVPQLQNPNC